MERNLISKTESMTQEELHLLCQPKLLGGGLLIVVTRYPPPTTDSGSHHKRICNNKRRGMFRRVTPHIKY